MVLSSCQRAAVRVGKSQDQEYNEASKILETHFSRRDVQASRNAEQYPDPRCHQGPVIVLLLGVTWEKLE